MSNQFLKTKKGFTIFFAMLVSSLALSIGLAIYDLTLRELDLASTVTQSTYAIYAADAGAECALYWDLNCTLGSCQAGSAFSTSTASTGLPGSGLVCNSVDITTSSWSLTLAASAATTTFTIPMSGAATAPCAKVTVAKNGNPAQTTVVSRGYNNCGSGYLQIERALQVNY